MEYLDIDQVRKLLKIKDNIDDFYIQRIINKHILTNITNKE